MNEPLRRALLRARLREDDIAARMGVDPKTVRRWLNGRVPYPHNRAAIAELVGADEADLWPDAGGPLAARTRPEETGDGLPAPVGCAAGGLGTAVRIGRARDRCPGLQRAVPRRGRGDPADSRREGAGGCQRADGARRPQRAERCRTRRRRRHELGDALAAEGDPGAAEAAWSQAIAILDRIRHPLADEVRARLRHLEADLIRQPGESAGVLICTRPDDGITDENA